MNLYHFNEKKTLTNASTNPIQRAEEEEEMGVTVKEEAQVMAMAMAVAVAAGGEIEFQIRGMAEDEAATVTVCLSAEDLSLSIPPLHIPCPIFWTWTTCFRPFQAGRPIKTGAAPAAPISTMLA